MSLDVPFNDIPQSVLEEVRRGIQHYFVPLLRLVPEHPEYPVDFGGSCTLVEIAGKHYILTAEHVWKKSESSPQIGLVLEAEGGAPTLLPILTDTIRPQRLVANEYSEAWGPDLALLQIPPSLVGTIAARKSFLNLARQRANLETHPLRMDKALWAIIGLVRQSSNVKPRAETGVVDADLRVAAFFSVACTAAQRNGHDYLTVSAKTTLPGVPSSFDGVSGGGLWQIPIAMEKGSVVWRGERTLGGVAFWQQPEPPDRIAIRCHGPKSIFEKAWEQWGLSHPIARTP